MDAAEVKSRLRTAIVSLVKDDADTFNAELKDVLVSKARARISPPAVKEADTDPVVDTTTDDDQDPNKDE